MNELLAEIIKRDWVEALRLAQNPANCKARDGEQHTALHLIAASEIPPDEERLVEPLIATLVQNGLDLNAGKDTGATALLLVAERGNTFMAGKLIELGADINQSTGFALTPLMAALQSHHFEVARLLLPHHPKLKGQSYGGMTPLNYAVAAKAPLDIIRLIAEGAPEMVDVPNKVEMTPLHHAAQTGNLEACQYLYSERGASASRESIRGWTALDYASHHRNQDLIRWMEDSGFPHGKGLRGAFAEILSPEELERVFGKKSKGDD